jgi:hypothetical protein
VLVSPDILLGDLHQIIQVTMGWTNSHLHLFKDGKVEYAPKEFELEYSKDYGKVKLDKLLKKGKDKILYEYDFGDGWRHDILLEKVIETDEKDQLPRCTGGERNCPPEDCGGIWGYADVLETIADPAHEEYGDMLEWLGDEFDPEYFDMEEINKSLNNFRPGRRV